MALLYGRAGRLTAKNGGLRPGQGVTDDETDDAVHANIVAVGYRTIPPPPAPPATALGCYVDKRDYDLPVCVALNVAVILTYPCIIH